MSLLLCFCSFVLWQRNVNIIDHLLWCHRHQRLSPALSSRGDYGSSEKTGVFWVRQLVDVHAGGLNSSAGPFPLPHLSLSYPHSQKYLGSGAHP